jgi:hypothetical protein
LDQAGRQAAASEDRPVEAHSVGRLRPAALAQAQAAGRLHPSAAAGLPAADKLDKTKRPGRSQSAPAGAIVAMKKQEREAILAFVNERYMDLSRRWDMGIYTPDLSSVDMGVGMINIGFSGPHNRITIFPTLESGDVSSDDYYRPSVNFICFNTIKPMRYNQRIQDYIRENMICRPIDYLGP